MSYRHVIVPLDGSELAECVLPHLEAVASNCQITTVELVRVVPPLEMHYKAAVPFDTREEKELNQAAIREAGEYLQKVKAGLDTSRMTVTTRVISGRVADSLIDYIKQSGADLLLMATHGRTGPSRWIWGSIAEKLLHSCGIPVFLIHPPGCIPEEKG